MTMTHKRKILLYFKLIDVLKYQDRPGQILIGRARARIRGFACRFFERFYGRIGKKMKKLQ